MPRGRARSNSSTVSCTTLAAGSSAVRPRAALPPSTATPGARDINSSAPSMGGSVARTSARRLPGSSVSTGASSAMPRRRRS
eukprot:591283-Prymnesium_polylepis.1